MRQSGSREEKPEVVERVGAQWELRRALARRDEGFGGVLRPGAYTSTPSSVDRLPS
jgi:hypothetical protein